MLPLITRELLGEKFLTTDTKDSGPRVNIKQLRENQGLNIKQCALATGVSRRLYYYWETYQRRIPTKRFQAVAKILKIKPGVLLEIYIDNYLENAS